MGEVKREEGRGVGEVKRGREREEWEKCREGRSKERRGEKGEEGRGERGEGVRGERRRGHVREDITTHRM